MNSSGKSRLRSGLLHAALACPVMIGCLMLQGCGEPDLKTRLEALEQPGDLIVDLGDGVRKHFVPIDELSLFVGKFEVSNAEFRLFRPDHSSGTYDEHTLDGDDQPVVNVSWFDAQAFCEWLNDNFGVIDGQRFVFRLPTVEEWETYARCGDDRQFPWGDHWPPPEDWNYYGSENPGAGRKLKGNHRYQVSSPVYEAGSNEWRLFGIGGNVWEWCEDSGDDAGSTRLLKGASWVDYHELFLNIERNRMYAPEYRAVNMGFRVVAEPGEEVAEPGEELPGDAPETGDEQAGSGEDADHQ